MTLPYNFISGDIARSAQVNANFQYLMDLIGQSSVPGSINPQGALVLGPRKTTTLSSEQDVGGYWNDFFQVSWNAAWKKIGNEFRFQRVLADVGGSALRIGIRGMEIFATPQRTGDIHTQLQPIFRVGYEDGGKFVFIPEDAYITSINGHPGIGPKYRRLTTVILEHPAPIYSNQAVGKGNSVLNAFNYGIPRNAAAIVIRAHVTAGWSSGAGMIFYPRGGSYFMGLAAHATITGTGMGMRTGAQGVVPINPSGEFVVDRTERFELANVHIIGYLV